MNMFHDKRIFYSDSEYLTRSYMTVLYWNENSGREIKSVWKSQGTRAGARSAPQRNNYSKPTYQYRDNVWQSYCRTLFGVVP